MLNRKGRNVALFAGVSLASAVMIFAGANPAAAPELDEIANVNPVNQVAAVNAIGERAGVVAQDASYEIETANVGELATAIVVPTVLEMSKLVMQDAVKVTVPPTGDQITAIGDSLMVGATPYLEELLPGISVDGRVGRPMPEGMGILADLNTADAVREYVVLGLATNAGVTVAQFDQIIDTIGPGRTLVMVNAYGDRSWIPGGNEQVEAAAAKYPGQIVVADWNALIAEHPEYIGGDGIHANEAGKQAWANMIVEALNEAAQIH